MKYIKLFEQQYDYIYNYKHGDENQKFELLCGLIENGDLFTLNYLLNDKYNKDIVIKDKDSTILHEACVHGNYRIVEFILNMNIIDVDATDSLGRTPLFMAVLFGNPKCVNVLLNHGADFNKKINNGSTPLIHAIKSKNNDILKLFNFQY